MLKLRGECKTPGGKLIAVEFAVVEGHLRDVVVSGDFFLYPEEALPLLLNMALDEVLTERVGAGTRPPTLRVWGWSGRCVVLGRFQSVRNEVDEEAAARHGVEIVRRISGG